MLLSLKLYKWIFFSCFRWRSEVAWSDLHSMSNSCNCCTDTCNSCHCHSIHGVVTDRHLLSGYQYPERNVYIQFLLLHMSCVIRKWKTLWQYRQGWGNLQFFLEMGQNRMSWGRCENGRRWQVINKEFLHPIKRLMFFSLFFWYVFWLL